MSTIAELLQEKDVAEMSPEIRALIARTLLHKDIPQAEVLLKVWLDGAQGGLRMASQMIANYKP